MLRAIALAQQAEFQTEPNPMVGSVLVSGSGDILGEGWHQAAGLPHAEVNSLMNFETVPPDSTLYVTLEPCNHQGRTPACTSLLLQKQVKHLVVGALDPNPQMSGRSIELLRDAGVQVETGLMGEACHAINRVFNKHITTKRPYVTAKVAITLDGKIATATGESQWITGAEAREYGHKLRSEHQGIAIGRGTLVADNPRLTNRNPGAPRQPAQILFSSSLDWPGGLAFFEPKKQPRYLVTKNNPPLGPLKKAQDLGVKTLVSDQPDPPVSWALDQLYQEGITSLLIEGGSGLLAGFLKENLVDRICAFVSPRIMGQPSAPSFSGEIGTRSLADIPEFHFAETQALGKDLLVELYLRETDVYRVD